MFIAMELTGSRDKAEELVHDTFLELIKHVDVLMGMEEPQCRSYVCKAIENRSINLCHWMKRKKQREQAEGKARIEVVDCQKTDQEAMERLEMEEIKHIICSLPEKYICILRLYFFCEYGPTEISEMLNIQVSLVKRRIYLGKRKLRMELAKKGIGINE